MTLGQDSGTIVITRAQAEAVARTLNRAPRSARYTIHQRPNGQLVMYDRQPGDHAWVRITSDGTCWPREAAAALNEYGPR